MCSAAGARHNNLEALWVAGSLFRAAAHKRITRTANQQRVAQLNSTVPVDSRARMDMITATRKQMLARWSGICSVDSPP